MNISETNKHRVSEKKIADGSGKKRDTITGVNISELGNRSFTLHEGTSFVFMDHEQTAFKLKGKEGLEKG